MIRILSIADDTVRELDDYEKGCWVEMIAPTKNEIQEIIDIFNVDEDYLTAALDREELSRIESDKDYGCSLVAINAPYASNGVNTLLYETIPVGIIETQSCVITVCLKEITALQDFTNGRIKNVFTNLRTRFILQLIDNITDKFVFYLRRINRKSNEVEKELHRSMDNQHLFDMLDLEKSTVYFSTALKSNEYVIDKVQTGRELRLFEDDNELIEDIQIETDQAISMCTIYSNILSGTMDAFASIISNNLNIVMKVLTAITILISIPTMISSFYGMNVEGAPVQHFWVIVVLSLIVTLISGYLLARLNLFK